MRYDQSYSLTVFKKLDRDEFYGGVVKIAIFRGGKRVTPRLMVGKEVPT